MNLPFVSQMYSAAAPELTTAEVDGVVSEAVARARVKHPDFDRFLPGMDFLSRHVFCAHGAIPIDDYLETLYCTVKHGDFTKSWRTQLKPNARATAI